jgi:hypothetical protein
VFTDSQEVLCVPTPRLYGFDFSYQGLLGIWEGFNPSSAPMYVQQFSEETPLPGQRSLLLDLPVGRVHSRAGSAGSSGGYENRSTNRSHSPADDLFGSWSAALLSLAARRGRDQSRVWRPGETLKGRSVIPIQYLTRLETHWRSLGLKSVVKRIFEVNTPFFFLLAVVYRE